MEDESSYSDPMVEALDSVEDSVMDATTVVVACTVLAADLVRIHRMIDYAFHSRTTFSLTRMPKNVCWDESWIPETLTYKDQPISLRVLGTAMSLDVVQDDEEGQRLCLSLELLRPVDQLKLLEILRMGTKQQGALTEYMHWSYTKINENDVFPHVYDATTTLRPKPMMRELGLSCVGRGDIVVVEGTCEKEGDSGGAWSVTFNMASISIVVKS
ncbi:hypothetical protein VTO73DRAFT_3514 [Trametes versicolor]